MENTTNSTSSEVKRFDYEGKIPEGKEYINEGGSDIGLYLILTLFIVVFFAVIFFQMYG
ncbi:hypothetical protein [Halobacteriovorax sp. YZS-1-1]|uniref:hypothetical protein n=1 Tax=unclassified Halobacteriovorax TaxID=2639665 RepID=UPI00399ABF08